MSNYHMNEITVCTGCDRSATVRAFQCACGVILSEMPCRGILQCKDVAKCKYCHAVYTNRSNLNKHMSGHGKIAKNRITNGLKCWICHKTYHTCCIEHKTECNPCIVE